MKNRLSKDKLEAVLKFSDRIVLELGADIGPRGGLSNIHYRNYIGEALPEPFLEPVSEIRTADELYRRLRKIASRFNFEDDYLIDSKIKPI